MKHGRVVCNACQALAVLTRPACRSRGAERHVSTYNPPTFMNMDRRASLSRNRKVTVDRCQIRQAHGLDGLAGLHGTFQAGSSSYAYLLCLLQITVLYIAIDIP
jgi:hypothetical protein